MILIYFAFPEFGAVFNTTNTAGGQSFLCRTIKGRGKKFGGNSQREDIFKEVSKRRDSPYI